MLSTDTNNNTEIVVAGSLPPLRDTFKLNLHKLYSLINFHLTNPLWSKDENWSNFLKCNVIHQISVSLKGLKVAKTNVKNLFEQNSGNHNFTLLKWGIHFRHWFLMPELLSKIGRNWELMPEVNSWPMPELSSERGRNWESMPEVNSSL